jgi:microcystin-dependent protein
MADPFLGEIRTFGFGYTPRNWAACNGQLLPINQNQALFALLGTMYGGNGTTNFALPDLRAATPLHVGPGVTQGQRGGADNITLAIGEVPAHGHSLMGTTELANSNLPAGAVPAAKGRTGVTRFAASGSDAQLASGAISSHAGGQPHSNTQPSLVLNLCIALAGIFPSRN